MTNDMMSCEQFNDCLMAYLERETDDATRAAVERHSITCGECGALLADLRKLRIDAANLPVLQPSRDLWSGIASRIEAPVLPIGSGRSSGVVVRQARRWMGAALIAASLVAAAGLGWMAARAGGQRAVGPVPPIAQSIPRADSQAQRELAPLTAPQPTAQVAENSGPRETQSAPVQTRAATPVAAPAAAATPAQLAVARLTADYDREIMKLRTLIAQRRNQMDSVTVGIIEKNLQVIDAAIADCKKAIARDPSSLFLIESLNQSLQSKVELMRTAALLPSRT